MAVPFVRGPVALNIVPAVLFGAPTLVTALLVDVLALTTLYLFPATKLADVVLLPSNPL